MGLLRTLWLRPSFYSLSSLLPRLCNWPPRLCFVGAGDTCTEFKVNKGLSCSLCVTFLFDFSMYGTKCNSTHTVMSALHIYAHVKVQCRGSRVYTVLSGVCATSLLQKVFTHLPLICLASDRRKIICLQQWKALSHCNWRQVVPRLCQLHQAQLNFWKGWEDNTFLLKSQNFKGKFHKREPLKKGTQLSTRVVSLLMF